LLLGDIGGRSGTDGDEYSCAAMRAVVMWWGSRGGGGVWICTTLLVWSRVVSRCPAGNMVRRTGFLPGLTRTNTGSVRVRFGLWGGDNEADAPSVRGRVWVAVMGVCLWFENPIACLFELVVMPEIDCFSGETIYGPASITPVVGLAVLLGFILQHNFLCRV